MKGAWLSVVLVGCVPLPTPVTALDVRGTTVPLEHLEEGRSLLRARCSSCHAPPPPRRKSAADWPDSVEEMAERSHLTEVERLRIVTYLQAFAEPEPAEGGAAP